ncbi:ATP-grasp domain-containing protein [Luteibacter sp. 621]|uniref:ATP-grasp domain-containing protein n=1 Tax=Luteibacter sp. 621 TaxID=3373916 RepID=UPI003D23C4E3
MIDPLLVEYLPGDEVTVDCFTDRHGRLVFAGARTRERVRAGIAMRSRPLPTDPAIQAITGAINDELVFRGPWFVQLKRDRFGEWKLLEIACRVAGAMVTHRAQGVNIPLLTVLDFKGMDVVAHADDRIALVDRRVTTRADFIFEFDTVYIDYDDTLVIDGKTVPAVIAFVYRMIALEKRIVLITRHASDLDDNLRAARLHPSLFDTIIHLRNGESKAAHMHARAIFIDNHYPERAEAARVHGIPVFDVDAVGFLG